MTKDFTVIIPSIKIAEALNNTLINCLKIKSLEKIIVAIDNDHDSKNKIIHPKIDYLYCEPGMNMSKKRNLVAKKSTTKYLLFYDSDSWPKNPDSAVLAKNILEKNQDIYAFGGPDISPPNQSFWKDVVSRMNLSFLISGFRNHRKKVSKAGYKKELSSSNLLMEKNKYFEMNGMDEKLYYAEDTDLFNRILNKGCKLYYDPYFLAYHSDRTLIGLIIKRYVGGAETSTATKKFFYKKIKKIKITSGEYRYEYLLTPIYSIYLMFYIFIKLKFTGFNFFSIIDFPIIFVLIMIFIDSIRISKITNIVHIFVLLNLISVVQSFASLFSYFGLELSIKKIYRNENDK